MFHQSLGASQAGTVLRGGHNGEKRFVGPKDVFLRQTLGDFAYSDACKKIQHNGDTEVGLHLLRKNVRDLRTIRAQNFCGNGFLTISQ